MLQDIKEEDTSSPEVKEEALSTTSSPEGDKKALIQRTKYPSNPYMKCQNYYIEYRGNFELDPLPEGFEYRNLGYCHHRDENKTYCILVLKEPMSRKKLANIIIPIIKAKSTTPYELTFQLHSNWETMFHPHIGLKPPHYRPCQNPGLGWKTVTSSHITTNTTEELISRYSKKIQKYKNLLQKNLYEGGGRGQQTKRKTYLILE